MGVLTDVVIADRDEAQMVADTDGPAVDRDGFTFNGFDRVQLCTLLSLLKASRPDVEFEHYLDRIDVISSSSGEWPTVSVVPPELVIELAAVAEMDEAEFDELVEPWAATEEFAGWAASDVQALLRQLGDLAETASLEGKCLMLWQTI